LNRQQQFAVATRRIATGCGLLGLISIAPHAALAQDIGRVLGQIARPDQSRAAVSPLARTEESASATREKTGTAFFVDASGDMLTVRHAAEGCIALIVAKEGRAVRAHVVALSADADLALIKVPRTLGLAAVFPRQAGVSANDMVFASAYDALRASRGMLVNATIASNQASSAGSLLIDSDITFGASGAPVLDGRGLVQGVVSRKVGDRRVIAVDAGQAKVFLTAHGIRFEEDDRAQIAGSASRANRAASISARVTCLQN
jgi:serine protease Do